MNATPTLTDMMSKLRDADVQHALEDRVLSSQRVCRKLADGAWTAEQTPHGEFLGYVMRRRTEKEMPAPGRYW